MIAAAVVSFPLVFKAARAAFETVDPQLEDAARSLGKNVFVYKMQALVLGEPPVLPEDVVERTADRYRELIERLGA